MNLNLVDENGKLDGYSLAVWLAAGFLVTVILLSIFIWWPEQEKQKEEIRKDMSCKQLQAYILNPKGFSDVATDVYMVKCI